MQIKDTTKKRRLIFLREYIRITEGAPCPEWWWCCDAPGHPGECLSPLAPRAFTRYRLAIAASGFKRI